MKLVIELLYLGSILFSGIMAAIYRKYMAGRMLTILIPYLFLVFMQETVLSFNTEYKFISSNSIVYNIYQPISAIVFSFIYFSIPFMVSVKKLIAGVMIIYLSLVLVNYLFFESIFKTSSYLPIARSFVITFCAVLFLFRYFNLDNIKQEKYWLPLVWITAGIAIFYPVITTSLAFQKYLAALNAELFGFKVYRLIPKVMSIFMYNCFSYAFYLCQKIK
jgi:hypothetical protein